MKFNVDKALLDLQGNVIPASSGTASKDDSPLTIGKAIGTLMSMHQGKKLGHLKLMILAKKFYMGGEVEVDEADFKQVVEIVEEDKSYIPLILGQILEELDKVKFGE